MLYSPMSISSLLQSGTRWRDYETFDTLDVNKPCFLNQLIDIRYFLGGDCPKKKGIFLDVKTRL